jgi:membrane protease YdiL (CAAX protease family)
MTITLGSSPWILIIITFLEVLFVLIPGFIASKVEKISLKAELKLMGLKISSKFQYISIIKILIGFLLGIFFFFIGGYINFFFVLLVSSIFGSQFAEQGSQGAINTQPIQPNLIQIVILIFLQIFIVAICEEAFFRGFLISKFQKKIKSVYAILISSIFFTLYHLPPFIVPITTFITFFGYYFSFGILLSLVFIITKETLLAPITAHGIFNVLILIF